MFKAMFKNLRYIAFVLFLGFSHITSARPLVNRLLTLKGLSGIYNGNINNNVNLFNNNFYTPQPVLMCSGAPIVIKGDIESPVPDTYVWEVLQGSTWVNAPGTNNTADYQASALVNTSSSSIIYDIRRRIITAGVTSYDSYYDVTVLSTAPITNNNITAPAVSSFCGSGTPATITGSVPSGGLGSTYSYQWQSSTDNVNFSDITGASNIDYTPTAQLSVTTYYRRIILGQCTTSPPSNVVTITIQTPVSNNNISAPAVSSFCGSGTPGAITGTTPSGGSGAYTYQWQSSTDNITFTDIAGATSATYNPPLLTVSTYYRRVTISGACTTPTTSNVAIIIISSSLSNNVITAPAVTTFCLAGSPASIPGSVPVGGSGTFAYQWQSSTDNVNFTNISGATAQNYQPGTLPVTTYYRRAITSGPCTTPLTSNVVTINVLPPPATPTLSQSTVAVCSGNVTTVSVNNPQTGITYNWYNSPSKGTPLYTGSSYTTGAVTSNMVLYVEAVNGLCISTSMASVQINAATYPAAPQLANSNVTICSGSAATFTVSSPQAGFTYNWYTSATATTPVFTGTGFTTPPLTVATTYYLEAVNSTGCPSTTRAQANVSISPSDQVTVQGASVCPGSTATLSASIASGNAVFNWYTTATGGTSVFTGSSLTTPALTADAVYYVEATNTTTGCVAATRVQVTAQVLQALPAPVVVVDNTTGNSITFKWAAVSGATGYKVSTDNGVTFTDPSSGSTGLTHVITGLKYNQSVTLVVVATGASNCQISAASTGATASAVNQGDDIYVPNAFTPNGDGKNDMIYVHSQNIKTMNFSVYDQWGELLFTSTSLSTGWDGTFKGNREPVGVYVYYLTAETISGLKLNKKGTITLLR